MAVPFTASTTKAMEMNKAMTSSVDLETHGSAFQKSTTDSISSRKKL